MKRGARLRERLVTVDPIHIGTAYLQFGSGTQKHVFGEFDAAGGFYSVKRTWDELHPGPPFKSGGPFNSYSSDYPYSQVEGRDNYTSGIYPYFYEGGFTPLTMGDSSPLLADMLSVGNEGPYGEDFGDSSSEGATAYKNAKPKLQGAEGALFLTELRDLPRQLSTSASAFADVWRSLGGSRTAFSPKKAADHFLNHQFGWVPFVNDLKKFNKAYQTSTQRINQMILDNGKWVRRKRAVSFTEDITDINYRADQDAPLVYPALVSYHYRFPYPGRAKWGWTVTARHTIRKVWFEGSFRYWIPALMKDHDPYFRTINRLNYYGARVSPSLLWEATPWSWLADWGTNLGDIIDNVTTQSASNLVSNYAYIMSTTTERWTHDSCIHMWNKDVFLHWDQDVVAKHRQVASPFGFGLDLTDLSLRQISILTALGVSKAW